MHAIHEQLLSAIRFVNTRMGGINYASYMRKGKTLRDPVQSLLKGINALICPPYAQNASYQGKAKLKAIQSLREETRRLNSLAVTTAFIGILDNRICGKALSSCGIIF